MTAKNTKKLTILHSNDLHGDFLAEHIDESLSVVFRYYLAISMMYERKKRMLYMPLREICSVVPSLTVNIRDYQQLKL